MTLLTVLPPRAPWWPQNSAARCALQSDGLLDGLLILVPVPTVVAAMLLIVPDAAADVMATAEGSVTVAVMGNAGRTTMADCLVAALMMAMMAVVVAAAAAKMIMQAVLAKAAGAGPVVVGVVAEPVGARDDGAPVLAVGDNGAAAGGAEAV